MDNLPELLRRLHLLQPRIEEIRRNQEKIKEQLGLLNNFLQQPGTEEKAITNAQGVKRIAREGIRVMSDGLQSLEDEEAMLLRAIEYERALEAGPWC